MGTEIEMLRNYDPLELDKDNDRLCYMFAVAESLVDLYMRDPKALDRKIARWFEGREINDVVPFDDQYIPKGLPSPNPFINLSTRQFLTVMAFIEIYTEYNKQNGSTGIGELFKLEP